MAGAENDDTFLGCDYCGTKQPGPHWLYLEVFRENPDGPAGDGDYLNLALCGPDHAGRYFAEDRLPAPDFSPSQPWRPSLRDRMEMIGVAAIAGVVVGLAGLGAWTIVRWLWT